MFWLYPPYVDILSSNCLPQITNYNLPTTTIFNSWDCLATSTCATICSSTSVACGVTYTTFTSLYASSRDTKQYYDINEYVNGVFATRYVIYTNPATISSSSSSLYSAGVRCITTTSTLTLTSSTTLTSTSTSTITSSTTLTDTSTVTSSTTLTATSTQPVTTSTTLTTTLTTPTIIYQTSTIQR